MAEQRKDTISVADLDRLKTTLEEIRVNVSGHRLERLDTLETRLEKLEQAVVAGAAATPPPKVEAVEPTDFVRSLASAIARVQTELLAEPGRVRYAIGPVRAQIKTHVQADAKGKLQLHLPHPGLKIQEATLAQLDFSVLPRGAPEEQGEEVLVPSVIGQPLTLARKQLVAAGLTAGRITYRDTDGRSDRVLEQSPPTGSTLLLPAAVDLTVSRSRFVEVPNVVGGPLVEVARGLAAIDLRYRTVKKPSSEVPAGTVLEQEPVGGERVERRAVVKMTVAVAPTGRPRRRPAKAAAKRRPRAAPKTVRKVGKKSRG